MSDSAAVPAAAGGDSPAESPVDLPSPPLAHYHAVTVEDTLQLARMLDPSSDGDKLYCLRNARGTEWSVTCRQR
jgi:hypothetical protein